MKCERKADNIKLINFMNMKVYVCLHLCFYSRVWRINNKVRLSLLVTIPIYEARYEKTRIWLMRKQRRRSAAQ